MWTAPGSLSLRPGPAAAYHPAVTPRVLLPSLLVALIAGSAGCQKKETKAPEPVAENKDDIEVATDRLLSYLRKGDYGSLVGISTDPLTGDLSREAFDDLSKIVVWLGSEKSREAAHTDGEFGGGVRTYKMQFENGGPLELEVSIAQTGQLTGFHFEGEGYGDAEQGVIAEQWRHFKVYDFAYVDSEGQDIPEGEACSGKRVDYRVVVGGIEALLGEHHLSVEKIVFDKDGNEVFHEPIAYDAKFSANAEGIPRGEISGYFEVPGPGTYEIDLLITDENASRDLDYRHPLIVK